MPSTRLIECGTEHLSPANARPLAGMDDSSNRALFIFWSLDVQAAIPKQSRQSRIDDFRRNQPIEVLKRKAELSASKNGITQEEWDYYEMRGKQLFNQFSGLPEVK